MAVDITVGDLAVALGVAASVDGTVSVPVDQDAILTRILAVATALVEDRAPDAPVAVQNEAAVRASGWMYDSDPASIRYTGPIMRSSGAGAILNPWTRRRLVGGSPAAGGAVAPGTGLPPVSGPERRLLEWDGADIVWRLLATVLAEELYAAFMGGEIPVAGEALFVESVDADARQIVVGHKPFPDTVDAIPQASSVRTFAEHPIRIDANHTGLTVDTKYSLDGLPDGRVYIRVRAPDGSGHIARTTVAALKAITSANAFGVPGPNAPHIQLSGEHSGTLTGYYIGRLNQDLWVSVPVTAAGGTWRLTILHELAWPRYFTVPLEPRIPAQALPALAEATRGRILAQAADSETWQLQETPPATIVDGSVTLAKLAEAVTARLLPAGTDASKLVDSVEVERTLIEYLQDQTVHLHPIAGTPEVVTDLSEASMLIHADPPPTNTQGVASMDAPNQGWPATSRVFVKLADTEVRTNYQIVFKSDTERDYAVPGSQWRPRTNLSASGFTFWEAWGQTIGNLVDSVELQTGLGDSIYTGQLGAGIVGAASLAGAVAALLLPAGGSDGQFLGRASGSPAWVDAPGGGGGAPVLLATLPRHSSLTTNLYVLKSDDEAAFNTLVAALRSDGPYSFIAWTADESTGIFPTEGIPTSGSFDRYIGSGIHGGDIYTVELRVTTASVLMKRVDKDNIALVWATADTAKLWGIP